MTDYCLQNIDEAEFNQLMLDTGLCVEVTEGKGKTAVTTVVPASYEVLIDRIGPITMWDYSVEPPTETVYPEYYSNLRLLFEPTEEQATQLAVFTIDPSAPQYRVWA
jgi:hypothetical protein